MSDGIVTPEAVVLSFDTAGVGSRIIAMAIDLAIQGAAALLVVGAAALFGATRLGLAGVYVGLFLVVFGYPIGLETLWRGRTVGKAVMGLRVVTVEGAPIRFRHALVRGALGLIDFWFTSGAAAVLCVLGTKRNQRLGDIAAGTLVLRERSSAPSLSAVTFWVPPGWEAYAATLDVSAVTGAEYQAVRSFLVRANTLDPWTREQLARQLATAVLPRLHHQPPAGVPAEAFLACVAALYQARQRRAPVATAARPQWGWAPGVPPPVSAAVSSPAAAAAPGWATTLPGPANRP
ncbi:MAG TPA: RDD family protein [Acidimicrobiales bacterium]|nr:RDD family protein [Acidimicrobiales bacterium]